MSKMRHTFEAARQAITSGCHAVMACSRRMETAYEDADYDLFAAQVPSPLFQRIGAAYLAVMASREYEAAASEASALESPRMPPVRITGQRRPAIPQSRHLEQQWVFVESDDGVLFE